MWRRAGSTESSGTWDPAGDARRTRIGCAFWGLSWLAGVVAFAAAAGIYGEDWAVPLVSWAIGQPLVVAAWTSTSGLRGTRKRLARAGCLVLAILLTALAGAAVLGAMVMGDLVSGV